MFRKVRAYLQHPLVASEVVSESQTMIVLKNGSEIHALPGNNPDTVRGFSPTLLIIDEAAFVKDEVYIAIEPSLAATNGQLILISTPYGKRGRFYESFDPDSGFETYVVPSRESPLITDEFLLARQRELTELEFNQEYLGEFMEEMDTYFPRELILNCVEEIEEHKEMISHTNYYLGVDCARYGLDSTVYITIAEDSFGMLRVVNMIETSKKPITDIVNRVQALQRVFNYRGIYIDATGLGAGAADMLKEKGVPLRNMPMSTNQERKGEGIQFTLQNKEKLYKNLKLLMEKGRIFFPNHKKLIHQLSELQVDYTDAGHLKLHHPERGHDDFPDALALACANFIKGTYKPLMAR